MMAYDNKIREGNYMEKVPFPDSIVTFIKRRPKANEPHGDNKFYYSRSSTRFSNALELSNWEENQSLRNFSKKFE